MPFRVSTNSNFLTFRNNLGFANERLSQISEQLATLKRVNRPSDDPNAANFILGVQEGSARIDQYQRNLNLADRNWQQIESSIGSMVDIFNRAKELAIQGNNGTLGSEQRANMATEINGLADQLLGLGNTNINGEYIFGGFFTRTEPFALDAAYPNADPAATYAGDANVKSIEISEGSTIDTQLRMDDFLVGTGAPGETPAFQTLAKLESALTSNNVDDTDPDSVGQALDDINAVITELTNRLARVGAQSNRIANTRDRVVKQSVLNQTFLEQVEGVDAAQAAYDFQRANVSLQAVIQSAGTVLSSPSLMSFLR